MGAPATCTGLSSQDEARLDVDTHQTVRYYTKMRRKCCTVGSERRRHRSLIDVIQDLEQENAAEIASSGVSPASDRPVPLDLSGAISEPMPIPGRFGQHAPGQALEQPPALPPGVPHHLRPSDDGSEPVPCPPGKACTEYLFISGQPGVLRGFSSSLRQKV